MSPMPDLVDVARRAQSHVDRQEHPEARALLGEALDDPEVRRTEPWPKTFAALVAKYGLATMHVLYDEEGSFTVLRAFLADVVRVVRPEVEGEWVKVKSTPLPHPFMGHDPALVATEYTLGPATLVESVEGEPGPRDPRDGHAYVVAVTLRVAGGDGLTRTAKLGCTSWTLAPRPVHFELTRFTAAELAGVRAAGRRHFTRDHSAHETWALRNVTEVLREGRGLARAAPAREASRREALQLVREALGQPSRNKYSLAISL